MSSQAVRAAVEARITAAGVTYQLKATDTPVAIPFIGSNSTKDVPSNGTPFITVEYPLATEESKSVGAPGSNRRREEGGFLVGLLVPQKSGVDYWLGRIEALRNLFRSADFGGVTTYQADPATMDDHNDNGAYYKLTFVVLYYMDIFA